MSYTSSTDARFLGKLDEWLQSRHELLVLIRYSHAGGSRDFEFFLSFEALTERLLGLPPRTCITAFRQLQLPIRGVVDHTFIARCLREIPDGSEYLLAETISRKYGQVAWYHCATGESHVELREDLEDSHGHPVAVGLYPPWLQDTDDVISAVVPDERGVVTTGVY